MSGGHRDYNDQFYIQEIIDGLNVTIGYNQPKDYVGLNKKYYQGLQKKMKVPKRVKKILIEYKDILHNIDWDVCGDSTIKKGYFEKKKNKLIKILQKLD